MWMEGKLVRHWPGPDIAGKVTARASHASSYINVSRICLAGGSTILTLGGFLG